MNTDGIEKTILLRSTRKRVWRALTDSAEFGSWFGMRIDGPFAPGARVRGTMVPTTVDAEVGKAQKEFEGMKFEIEVERMEPERIFSFRWHPHAVDLAHDYSAEPTTLVEFELAEEAAGIRLTVTESGFDRIPLERRAEAFQSNDEGWSIMVKVIEKYIAQTQ